MLSLFQSILHRNDNFFEFEGGSDKQLPFVQEWMHRDPALFAFLMERNTEVACNYRELQVEDSASACSSSYLGG